MNIHPTELLPAYVLGALDEQDTHVVAAHLHVCPLCREEAESFRVSVGMAPNSLPPPHPPAHIKRQLMARVREVSFPRRHNNLNAVMLPFTSNNVTSVFAVASLVLALVFGFMMIDSRRQLVNAQQAIQMLQREENSQQKQQVAAFLSNPATLSQPMTGPKSGASANMYMQAGHNRAVLLVSGLPAPEPGKAYQFWFASDAGQVPATVFTVDAQGVAQVVCDAPAPVDSYSDVMVTVEPSGGSKLPSRTVVLAAKLHA